MSEQLLKEILGELKGMKTEIQEVKSSQARLESKVDKLELRIENEVIDKVRALFDTRETHLEYFASIRDSQARTEEALDILVDRAIRQDRKLDEHDRELRLLRIEK